MSSESGKAIPFIASRYDVKYRLGDGGMGVVYKAWDTYLSKDVAIKLLKNSADQQSNLRFQKEAKLCAQLNNPFILNALDFGTTEDGRAYLVLDYIDGTTLADYIESRGRLSVTETLNLLAQICVAMSYAHDKNILHRDLKPSNVMLIEKADGSLAIKLMDFGIAKRLTADDPTLQKLTATGAGLGSPVYMSPEQARGSDVDKRSDIYSAGCMAFEMLTGKPPIVGDSALETIQLKTLSDAPSIFNTLSKSECPDALEKIVARSLSRSANERYQSFQEIHEEVMKLLHAGHADVDYSSYAIPPAARHDFGKNKTLQMVLGTILLLTLTVAAFLKINPIEKKSDQSQPVKNFQKFNMPSPRDDVNLEKKDTVTISSPKITREFLTEERDSWPRKVAWSKTINRIKFVHCTIECEVTEILEKFPLGNLSFSACVLNDRNLKNIANLPLTEFCAVRCEPGIGTATLIPLSKRPLSRIDIEQPILNDEGVNVIASMKSLDTLHLVADGFSARGVGALNKLPQLTTLNFGGKTFNEEFLDPLSKCKTLTTLRLNGVTPGALRSKGLAKLANLNKLELLGFRKSQLSGVDLASFNSLTVYALHLDETKLDDSAVDMILKNPHITEIRIIGFKNLSDTHIMALASKPGLKMLGLPDAESMLPSDMVNKIKEKFPNLLMKATN